MVISCVATTDAISFLPTGFFGLVLPVLSWTETLWAVLVTSTVFFLFIRALYRSEWKEVHS